MKSKKQRTNKKLRSNSYKRGLFLSLGFTLIALITFGAYRLIAHPLSINLIGSANIPDQVDVIVAGAGLGGTSAAVQAARMGSKVLLVEETDYLGGQGGAAGVSSFDVGENEWNQGIYREFQNKINTKYTTLNLPTDNKVCWTGACFEPKMVNATLAEMIAAEPNLTLLTRNSITAVQKNGSAIKSVTLKSGQIVKTKVLIDATEYGDVIPLTGNRYRAGNSTSDNLNPNACIQDITYTAVVKEYPNGLPTNLRITTAPPGYTDTVRQMFASIVTTNGKYGWPLNYPVNFAFHNTYRGMPNSTDKTSTLTKTGINWANDYPANHPYISYTDSPRLSVRYLTDKNYRQQINCEAKLRTIQFIYYLQTDLGATNWSVATDEGYATAYNLTDNSCSNIPTELKEIERNLPVMPYVRESIRGVGLDTVTAKNINRLGTPPQGATRYTDSIAIGSYGNDLHNCSSDDTLETAIETRADISHTQGPYQIPLKALIASDVDGLIFAEKNLSQTRLASGATRVHPTVMLTGQAAGTLAALAVQTNTSPRNLDPAKVQSRLLSDRSILYPFRDINTSNTHFISTQTLALRGITSGIGNQTFGTNTSLTRAQLATFLTRAIQLPTTTYEGIFADVPANSPYAPYIEALSRNQITSGCLAATATTKAKFCPDDNITNAQLAILAIKAWEKSGHATDNSFPTSPTYSDVPSSHIAYRYVESLAKLGIKWYCNEATRSFCPNNGVNREIGGYVIGSLLNYQ